ncbi:NUDIX domain-containing protein [Desulfothermus naphthae]
MNKETLNLLKKNLSPIPGIMGREKFFNAAVLIPLLEKGEEYFFLFEKRAYNIRQGGEISFPGGEFDPTQDRSCVNAALRETEEEIGLSREKIEVIGRLDTFVSPRGLIIESFIGILNIDENDLHPDEREVEEIFTIPVSWFEKNPPEKYRANVEVKPYFINENGEKIFTFPVDNLGLPPQYKDPWPSLDYDVFVFKNPYTIVWGITARLIVEFILKINPDYLGTY